MNMASKTRRGVKPTTVQVNFNTGTILKVVGVILAVAAVYFLRDIVIILLFALLLSALIEPVANRFEKYHLPRSLSVILVYLLIILLAIGIIILIVPPIIGQLRELLTQFAPMIDQAFGYNIKIDGLLSSDLFEQDVQSLMNTITQAGLADAVPQIFKLVSDIFGGLITVFVVFALAFYMVVEEKLLKRGLDLTLSKKYENYVLKVAPDLRRRVGSWLHGELLLMFSIFLMTYLALLIIGVPYPLVLAVIAGLLEAVLFIGPTLSVVPAVLIAFTVSPLHAILVLLVYFGIQQFEGEFLVPMVMKKTVGLNPVVSIISIMIGYEIAGVLGAILAIPCAVVITVFLQEWFKHNRTNKSLV
jgi:predicted PurR-regulated permease PerM